MEQREGAELTLRSAMKTPVQINGKPALYHLFPYRALLPQYFRDQYLKKHEGRHGIFGKYRLQFTGIP